MRTLTEDEAAELREGMDGSGEIVDVPNFGPAHVLLMGLRVVGLIRPIDCSLGGEVWVTTPRGRMALRIHDAIALGAGVTGGGHG